MLGVLDIVLDRLIWGRDVSGLWSRSDAAMYCVSGGVSGINVGRRARMRFF